MKKWLIVLLMCISWNALAAESEFLPVAEAFKFQSQVTDNKLEMSWGIHNGYYLYFSRISAEQGNKPLVLSFKQVGIKKVDEYFGEVVIFHDQLDVQAQLTDDTPVTIRFQGCAEAGLCYPPVTLTYTPEKPISSSDVLASQEEGKTLQKEGKASQEEDKTLQEKDKAPQEEDKAPPEDKKSLIWQLLLFLGLGIGLAFTPCVFPMFPILSSIIVGQGNISTKKSFLYSLSYVLGMAFTYALAGVIVGYFGAAANIQLYLQTPWVLTIFATLFMLLSLSMFGLFELALPRFIQDKLQGAGDYQGGGKVISIVVMGAISALVVSPCVSAPLAGILAYISATGNAVIGGLSLLFLALGMGIPLLVIGTGGARFLPKSGNWMNSIKSVFGVALLAVAIWLLERILMPQMTLLLWAALLIGSSVYLGAFESVSTGLQKLSKALGLLFFIAGGLMMVGVASGQSDPLQPLSFLSSPNQTRAFNRVSNEQENTGTAHRITTKAEFDQALSQAQAAQKIMILDFYADWCIACKILDKEVFSDSEVASALQDFVFVQLDMTSNSSEQLALLDEFNLFGPPGVLFFKDKKALEGEELIGEFNKATFLASLQRLR